MVVFVHGMIAMGYVLAGLFFLKFWRRSGDALFAKFAAAFWLFALNEAVIAMITDPLGEKSWPYLLRLAGFALIAVAILQKNAAPRSRRVAPPGE